MHRYIARANVDHYIALLNGADLMPDRRSAITKMLISEADELGRDLEQLEFFENRAAAGRKRVETVAHLRDGFAFGTPDCGASRNDEGESRHFSYTQIGRTSIEPMRALGIRAAIPMASLRSFASTR